MTFTAMFAIRTSPYFIEIPIGQTIPILSDQLAIAPTTERGGAYVIVDVTCVGIAPMPWAMRRASKKFWLV